ncbi:MAG: hypothetical protein ABIK83_11275 [Candidatus Zixiibacteriota bacterium]
MPDLTFNKSTDEEHEIELDSSLIYAVWKRGAAIAGQTAGFTIGTAFVGNGARIKIKGKSENGENLGKISATISNNVYDGEFEIPEDTEIDDQIYFEVKLPDNGLDGESDRIPVVPPPEISNMRWSQSEARRGDTLTLSADVRNVRPHTEVMLTIYEYDRDSAHDKITELRAEVIDDKIEQEWEYEYHEDTDEIPTEEEMQEYGRNYNPPEYFFTIKLNDIEYGREQESRLLIFKDWIEIRVLNYTGNESYILHLADGSERRGTFGGDGTAREEDVPPGRCSIEVEREN